MASSSSSKYEVFLSFRREDTGRTFVSHLYRSLSQKRIRTYKDENEQRRDGRINPDVERAIRDANVVVVVISENYASSAWCLDVLAEIIESSRFKFRRTIIPVFYEVDPGDLRSPTGKFADDLRRHQGRENPETVNRWRNAMERMETTDPKFSSRNWEDDSKMLAELINSISLAIQSASGIIRNLGLIRHGNSKASISAESSSLTMGLKSDIYTKHIPQSLSEPGQTQLERYAQEDDMSNESPSHDSSNGLVGMYRHKNAVYGLLDLEAKNNVRTVGIWGIQGVGKTTLAECVYDDISRHFQHHCFLSNVNDIYQYHISSSLLKHVPKTRTSTNIFDAIKPNLVNRKVLLVVDGVDSRKNDQFTDANKVTRWLGPGSRVIMTSRFDYEVKFCQVKYEMECMRYDEALQLFSLFAFKKTDPLIGFEGLSIRAVQFAGRRPLALKVLGSFLYDKDEESWKRTLRKLESSVDNGSRQISNYIGACEYLPRRQTEMEQYVGADEEKHSPSYQMLL